MKIKLIVLVIFTLLFSGLPVFCENNAESVYPTPPSTAGGWISFTNNTNYVLVLSYPSTAKYIQNVWLWRDGGSFSITGPTNISVGETIYVTYDPPNNVCAEVNAYGINFHIYIQNQVNLGYIILGFGGFGFPVIDSRKPPPPEDTMLQKMSTTLNFGDYQATYFNNTYKIPDNGWGPGIGWMAWYGGAVFYEWVNGETVLGWPEVISGFDDAPGYIYFAVAFNGPSNDANTKKL